MWKVRVWTRADVLLDGGCFPPPEVDLTLHHGLERFAGLDGPQLVDEEVHVDADQAHVFGQPFGVGREGGFGVGERRRRSEEGVEELGVGEDEGSEERLEREFSVCGRARISYTSIRARESKTGAAPSLGSNISGTPISCKVGMVSSTGQVSPKTV